MYMPATTRIAIDFSNLIFFDSMNVNANPSELKRRGLRSWLHAMIIDQGYRTKTMALLCKSRDVEPTGVGISSVLVSPADASA
jgi:hypothetical protein